LAPVILALLAAVWLFGSHITQTAGATAQDCSARPGDLDTTFAGTGRVLSGGSGHEGARALLVQPDGRIISGGYTVAGDDAGFAVARHEANGTADATFAGGGLATTDFGSGDDQLYALALQTDGRLIAAGQADNGSDSDFGLARYESDGNLDASFGISGRVLTDFGSGDDIARAVAIQPDGRIVVAGVARSSAGSQIALARYDADGSLDGSFGQSGLVTTTLGSYAGANALLLLGNGTLVVAGYSWNGTDYDLVLARYEADGSLDTTFGDGGRTITDLGGRSERLLALVARPGGGFLVAGHSADIPLGGNYDFLLAAYTDTGTLDAGFGSGGVAQADYSGDDALEAVAFQPDGKVVAAGYILNESYDFAATRYDLTGSLDTTFGNNGLATVDMAGGTDLGRALAVQGDGRLLLAGSAWDGEQSEIGLARLGQGFTCLAIARSGQDLFLEWVDSGAGTYQVCRTVDDPYGVGVLIGSGTTGFHDAGILDLPGGNYSYRLVTLGDCNAVPASNVVGAFAFSLVPGG